MKHPILEALRLCSIGLMALAGLATSGLAQAQTDNGAYPTRPIRILVGYAPGGTTDIIARMVALRLQEAWGQPVVVDNKVGASSNIASEEVARAKPDGYTLLLATIANATNMSVYKKLNYDTLRSFAPITQFVATPSVLFVPAVSPAKTLKDLMGMAKSKPSALSFASSGNGGTPHLAGELLKLRGGIEMLHVPYNGTAPALNALLAGDVSLAFITAVAAVPQARNPKLRALAVTGKQRLPQMPEVPTMDEAGIDNFDVSSWNGLMAPAGTPPAVIAKLHQELVRILALPDVRAALAAQAATPVGSTPEQFLAYVRTEIERWGRVVQATGTKLE